MLILLLKKLKSNCPQIFAAIAANLVSFSFGVYTGWPATVSPLLKNQTLTPLQEVLTENSISWACSWGMLSAILGTFFWGLLADSYGRKITGFLTMIPFLLSWIILLMVKTESALMAARFLGGLGASGSAINIPMYVGEISDANMKAGLGSLFILMYNIGVLYVYVFGSFVDYDTLNVACLLVSVLYMIVWCYVPESPIYLIRQSKTDEAKKSLKWLRSKNNDKEVEDEINSLTHCGDHLTKAKLKDYFEEKTIKALLIGIVLQTGTQFSGINIILMYTVDIFQQSGSTMLPQTCTIFVGAVQVVGSVIASCVVNRAGRKFFLIVTYALTAIALTTIGFCFHANKLDKDFNTGALPVISLSVHVMAFSIGVGMVPYIIYAEIFPANVRNVCMSVLMFWNNALGFGVIKIYPKMMDFMHISGCFWVLGFLCLLVVPYTYFFVPETKNRSIDVIRDNVFACCSDSQNSDESGRANTVQTKVQNGYVEKNAACFAEA